MGKEVSLDIVSDEEVEEEGVDEEVACIYNESKETQKKTSNRYHNVINLMVRMLIQPIQIKNTVHVLSVYYVDTVDTIMYVM